MDILGYLEFITKIKKANKEDNAYALLRWYDNQNIIEELSTKIPLQKDLVKLDYFPENLDVIIKRKMHYSYSANNSISNLLRWGTKLIFVFINHINEYTYYKEKYERYLFEENYDKALMILDTIESKVGYSVWGTYQRFLLLNFMNKQEVIQEYLNYIQENADSSSFASLLLLYYYKMADDGVGFEEYNSSVIQLLSSDDSNNIEWRYFQYKLNILEPKTIQEIKCALIFDEQISLIDYYDTYVDALQLLSKRNKTYHVIAECLTCIRRLSTDFRIKNLCISNLNLDDSIILDDKVCTLIENYTCGKYEEMVDMFAKYSNDYSKDFVILNLLIKSGRVNVDKYNLKHENIWRELSNIYTFNYEKKTSFHILGGYYKLFYGTSWRYKILSVLVRKLNFSYDDNILYLSVINDSIYTPLFYQCILLEKNKIKFLNFFLEMAPVTTQLQMFMLTGLIEQEAISSIDTMRWEYYRLQRLVIEERYQEAINRCDTYFNNYPINHDILYYQERMRRTLFNCYLATEMYEDAMNLYVNSYLIRCELIEHMNLKNLVEGIEKITDENEVIKGNINRPIILRLYYKNSLDEIVSSYLDYLESRNCRTIKNLLDQYIDINDKDILFLNKVCVQSLLMKDYVSKTEVGGSSAELRAEILRTLIKFDVNREKEYLTELNSIYKATQLQKKKDSFNHNRIFIDTENLFIYMRDELIKEFTKYKAVQEIKKLLHDSRNTMNSIFDSFKFVSEQYWDNHRFFYKIVDSIKCAYLYDSPYSLENFLSTRIRHNYCNDNLKKVFEAERLFSKKILDKSVDYIINDYWKKKLSDYDYNIIIRHLSDFSMEIDSKIQEIKDKWIRIKKDENSDGLFNYIDFTNYFMNYVLFDFENIMNDVEAFFNGVVSYLDIFTGKILEKIRDKIDVELKPYYYNAIVNLESQLQEINFDKAIKSEMTRHIEISKAKYTEDIEGFKDIFNIEHEKYPDFTLEELVEFCCEIEKDMNRNFENANIRCNIMCKDKYNGVIFPYLVDIIGILIRNAVVHSQIHNMDELSIDINIKPYYNSEVYNKRINEGYQDILPDWFFKDDDKVIVFDIKNNLDPGVDEETMNNKVAEKIKDIYEGKYKEQSISEGGSGLYKTARTIFYGLHSPAIYYSNPEDAYFSISIAMDISRYERMES